MKPIAISTPDVERATDFAPNRLHYPCVPDESGNSLFTLY